MRFGVIDIGSNSVRFMLSEGGLTKYKKVITTKLAKGMKDKMLSNEAVERTVRAVSFFVEHALQEKVDKTLCYATAAVRSANNKEYFLEQVKKACGLDVEVVDGKTECLLGLMGACEGKDGAIIDVGGASTEIAVIKGGKVIYSHSLDVGAVKLTDAFLQNRENSQKYLLTLVKEYGDVPAVNVKGIGGTATTVSAVLQELEIYDPLKVDGSFVSVKDLSSLIDRLYSMTIEERKKLKGLQPERAEVIGNGCLILLSVMQYLGIDGITVSEKDNLEGYLNYYLERR